MSSVHKVVTILLIFFGQSLQVKGHSNDDGSKTEAKPIDPTLLGNQHYLSKLHASSSTSTSSSSSSSLLHNPSYYENTFPSSRRSIRDSLTSLSQLRMVEEKAVAKNVTGQMGQHVYLHCIVEPIGDKTISWLRLKDFHLLTVGLVTYTHDSRFVIRHGTFQANDWSLEIKHLVPKDEGLYECQVNTDPPRSQYYYLRVVVPYAKMIGQPDDMVVRVGSTINLSCIISRSPNKPKYVFWYQNDRMVNYDYNNNGRGEVTMTKDADKVDTVISRLIIKNAKHGDSGNYTCAPSNAEPTSIYVNVLQDEKRMSKNWPQNDEGSSTEYTSLSNNNIINLNTIGKVLSLLIMLLFNLTYTNRTI